MAETEKVRIDARRLTAEARLRRRAADDARELANFYLARAGRMAGEADRAETAAAEAAVPGDL